MTGEDDEGLERDWRKWTASLERVSERASEPSLCWDQQDRSEMAVMCQTWCDVTWCDGGELHWEAWSWASWQGCAVWGSGSGGWPVLSGLQLLVLRPLFFFKHMISVNSLSSADFFFLSFFLFLCCFSSFRSFCLLVYFFVRLSLTVFLFAFTPQCFLQLVLQSLFSCHVESAEGLPPTAVQRHADSLCNLSITPALSPQIAGDFYEAFEN